MDKSAQSMTQNELAHSLNTNRLLVGMCVAGVLAIVVQLAIEVVSAPRSPLRSRNMADALFREALFRLLVFGFFAWGISVFRRRIAGVREELKRRTERTISAG